MIEISGPYEFELHLSATDVPEGQIALADMARVASALHELATRVGRLRADQFGTGRSRSAVESAAQLRLTGVRQGSTTLMVEQGASDTLPFDDGLEQRTHDSLIEVFEAVATDEPPAWATPRIKESVVALVDALGGTSREVRVERSGQDPIVIKPQHAHREVWSVREQQTEDRVEMIGRVEAVDLRTSRFRLRDAVGNTIALHHVVDADRVARLVGEQALATGAAIIGDRGQVVGVERPELAPAPPWPESWTTRAVMDLDAILASAPGPDPDGGVELTDEEFASWLEAMDH